MMYTKRYGPLTLVFELPYHFVAADQVWSAALGYVVTIKEIVPKIPEEDGSWVVLNTGRRHSIHSFFMNFGLVDDPQYSANVIALATARLTQP